MILLFYIFAALLVFLSYKSFRGGIAYLNYFKSELGKPRSGYTPFVSLIVPCRGLDDGLENNLLTLLRQEYPAYEVIFVVDDADDPAAAVIENIRGNFRRRDSGKQTIVDTRLIIASTANGSSQKVENLREAVLHADAQSEVFAFADSDARPLAGWLRSLIAPLADETVGAATGYRWFISRQPGFASEMRSVWNASIASALGPNTKNNFCWGGAMAVRRETFEKLDLRKQWSGTLSDDFAVTRAMNAAGLPIRFVPQALTASFENCTFRELLEFTTRQMKITRVYAPNLWMLSFFGSGLFTSVMLAAFSIVIFTRENLPAVWAAAVTILLVSFFSIGKSWLRLKAVKLALPGYDQQLKRQFLPQNTLWLLTPPIFLYNCLAAWTSRRMTWRGTRYELVSPSETKVLD
ncbi:MAG TPA: glycosyltransferase family 2 protein [Pyrinomonadaceae bacterium]|nr:glycosyltransferase family 2 protein [Pyrinomonadaceae bacterium]